MIKKLLFSLLGFTTFCNAQIVNIPDANFKAKLLSASTSNFIASASPPVYIAIYNNWSNGSPSAVDTNGDGQIQLSEAQAIKCLDMQNSGIADLTGIEAFTNLMSLRLAVNNLTTLDVSQNTALINLRCETNQLTSLTVGPNNTLQDLHCFGNQLTTLDVSQSSALKKLYCNNNALTSLNVTQCTALQLLFCEFNNLPSIDVSQNTALTKLHCPYNQLTSLNVSGSIALTSVDCFNNNLTVLDFSGSPALAYLRAEHNDLTSLNVSQCPALYHLECFDNQLTSLDVTQLTSLQLLYCHFNQLTSLDVSQCFPMNKLDCGENDLTVLNLKNGNTTWTVMDIYPNPTMQYVCADEEDIPLVLAYMNEYPDCHVNTYCTFTPGGNFYEITGAANFDFNNNGCDPSDLNYTNLNYTFTYGSITETLIGDQTGNYYMPVGTGTFAVSPNLENPTYFNVSPSNFNVSFPAQASPFLQDFCITPNGTHHDVEIFIVPVNFARPGFEAKYKIVFKNKGNQVGNGTISFTYNDELMDFISSVPIYDSQMGGSFAWNYTNLQPFEVREVYIDFSINEPVETPPVNIDDVLVYTASITGSGTDDTPADNTNTLDQTVVGSYDPNDKTCLEGESIVPAMVGQYVHYLIRFENTGTFQAENIVVKDMIDMSKFEIGTLRVLHASHEFVTRINGNKVEFIFEGINLPFDDANNDGYVVFKIKTKSNLVLGNTFSNSANIYFDYNYPIVTNNYTTTVQNALGVPDKAFAQKLVAYPNPVKDIINFKTAGNVLKIEIFDLAGRILYSLKVSENQADLSALQAGNYFVKIYTETGIISSKISKE